MLDLRLVKEQLRRITTNNGVAAVILYGSALYKKKPGDIDILILVDDIENGMKQLPEIMINIKKLELSSGLKYHFQPPKPFTFWWGLLLKGEPWILSSLKNSLVLKDKYKAVREAKAIIKALKQSAREERADRLLQRAESYLYSTKEKLMKCLPILLQAATEAFQLFLLLHGEVAINKRKIASKIEEFGDFQHESGSYLELIDLQEKAQKGVLSEFTGENVDHYKRDVEAIIKKVENKIIKESK